MICMIMKSGVMQNFPIPVTSIGHASEVFDEYVFDDDGDFVRGAEPMAEYSNDGLQVRKGIFEMVIER